MIKFLISIFLLTSCCCHAQHSNKSDFIFVCDSFKYKITDYKIFEDIIFVLIEDIEMNEIQGFMCDINDSWVYPRMYLDVVVEKSIMISEDECLDIFFR